MLVRSLRSVDGTLLQDKTATTDAEGRVSTEIEVDNDGRDDPVRVTGYLVVDAPGAALTFENFGVWRGRRPEDVAPLRLTQGYEVTGKVQRNDGQPVPGATITLHAFASNWSPWRINYPGAGIVTSQASGKTGTDGSFSLRPIAINQQNYGNGDPTLRLNVSATATINGQAWAGQTEMWARTMVGAPAPVPAPAAPAPPDPMSIIPVYPTLDVRGRVLDAVSGAPVAGAGVSLMGSPNMVISTLAPVTTNQDGTFEFKGVPAVFQLFAQVTHPNMSRGWARIGEERLQVLNKNAKEPKVYDGIEVKLRPWATVSGKIVDMDTNKAPLAPMSIEAVYDEGYNDGTIGVGHSVVSGKAAPDATFTIKLPVGFNHVRVRGEGYWEGGRENPLDLDIKPGAQQGQVFPVRALKGYLLKFETKNPRGLEDCTLTTRTPDGKESEQSLAPLRHIRAKEWGEKMQIRMMRGKDEVLPWTEITANQKNWPQAFQIP